MLEALFKGSLNISLYAAVVAVGIMLIKAAAGKRLSPGFHYGIWCLFLLKLIFPFELKSVFSIFTLFNRTAVVPVTERVNTVLPPVASGALAQTAQSQPQSLTGQLPGLAPGLDPWNIAAAIWLAGILAMLAVLLFSYIKTGRTIRETFEEPDRRLLDILAACKEELRMRSRVPVFITQSFGVPFIFGFLKPGIVLPGHIPNNLPDEEIKAILCHELMHIKRKDHLVNLVLFLIKSVYWFNPIVWLSFAWMKNDGERACDSAVVKNYSPARRGQYAGALLDVAFRAGKQPRIVAVSSFTEGNFKQRVKNILAGRRYSHFTAFAAVIVIVMAAVVLLSCTPDRGGNNIPGGSISENQDQIDKDAVVNLVEEFGRKLQLVSLLAPEETVSQSISENYGGFIAPALLAEWQRDHRDVPGRAVSSPWPDRIEVLEAEKLAESSYEVKGEIIEITSVEQVNGGAAARRPITLSVEKIDSRWLITAVTLGVYEEAANSVVYRNSQYGFSFSLPVSWRGYSVITETWEGYAVEGTQGVVETGPLLSIRHPQWTEQIPRQDIPILIFTLDQWEAMRQEKFHIGAAPMGPSELGRNTRYVFALPARYNYAFPTGFEEVEDILENNPLHPE